MSEQKSRKRKRKYGRKRGTGRIGTIILRKQKNRDRHTKFIIVHDEVILKPHWRGNQRKDGTFEELEISNKDNLIKY